MPARSLSDAETDRFSRHVLLRELGVEGQERLLNSSVHVTRLDADGRACALWLARSGVGAVSFDVDPSPAPEVDPSGLLEAEDAGKPLSDVVAARLPFHFPGLAVSLGRSAGSVLVEPVGGARAALAFVRSLS